MLLGFDFPIVNKLGISVSMFRSKTKMTGKKPVIFIGNYPILVFRPRMEAGYL